MDPVSHSRFIVRGNTLDAHREAQAILTDANAAADRMRAELDAERRRVVAEARREGLRQGISEAAEIVAHAGNAIDAFWREREGELADIAFAIAHRIIASLPADEALVRMASEAIAEHAASVQLTLRVAPEAAVYLRHSLMTMEQGHRVTVVPDPAAAPGECTLVHKSGRMELGLVAQFRAMMNELSGEEPDMGPR
jgi:type III secretion protein L